MQVATESEIDLKFLPEAQSFAICMICDRDYAAGTEKCKNCGTTLSEVRRCPACKKVLSSKHHRCIYCSTSFLVTEPSQEPKEIALTGRKPQKTDHTNAIIFSAIIFLAVFLGSIAFQQFRSRTTRNAVLADSYVYEATPVRSEPNSTAPRVATLAPGTVIAITELANDAEGDRWVQIATRGIKEYVPLAAIAPPKIKNLEYGAPILRVWLTSFNNAAHASDALSAVNYLCTEFKNASQCEELRWVLFGRMRHMRSRTANKELTQKTKEILELIAAGSGTHAQEASDALKELVTTGPKEEYITGTAEGIATGNNKPHGMQPRQYSLVDRAEVRVRINDIGSLKTGEMIQAPIAAPIVVNGDLVVPANALCILKVMAKNQNERSVTLQLLALEFNNRRFDVQTDAKQIAVTGSTVVFDINSSLLIGR